MRTQITTKVPGQNGQLTFTGTAGHRISLAHTHGDVTTTDYDALGRVTRVVRLYL